MQRTLFFIPHSIFGIPVFGFGWALGLLALALGIWMALAARDPNRRIGVELKRNGVLWAVAAAVIAFVLPQLEIPSMAGPPVGIPVRGYGVLLLMGVAAGIGLALLRARRSGISADAIFGLAFWLFVGGIGGARLFYVVQYRSEFVGDDLASTIGRLLNFTGGGLVVYGSIIGGTLAMILFCRRHKISPLQMGDVVIPCLFLGIFFGRLGCLLNGCCYGGRCEDVPTALHFPTGSPVYIDQMQSGALLGLTLEPISEETPSAAGEDVIPHDLRRVTSVDPRGPASLRGIEPGDRVSSIDMVLPRPEKVAPGAPKDDMSGASWRVVIDGKAHVWDADELPSRALAVRPAQVISSFNGLWICGVLLLLSHLVRLRPGVLMATGFLIYGFVRIGEEIVRSDEPGQFGTELSISQWVSLAVIPASIALIAYIYTVRPTAPASQTHTNPGTGAGT